MSEIKQKGFTLVELIAVMVVLAIILAIAAPAIIGIVRNATRMAFASDAKLVLKGIDYKKLVNDTFDPTIINNGNINQLLGISNENYRSVAISLNEDNKPIINIIGINKWGGFIACGTYRDMKVVESPIDCDVNLMSPVITVLGDNPTSIYSGDTYVDAGAIAYDYTDGDITDKIVVTGTVNTRIAGEFIITYTVTDSDGNIATASRTVYVLDHSAPVITILGDNPANVEIGSIYDDAGATALDDVDGDITNKIKVTSDVNPSVLGVYTVTYEVTDNAGNMAAPVTRTVNVVDTSPPTASVSVSSKTTNSITVIGSGTDPQTGITKYEYAIDNGSYVDKGLTTTYTFIGVTTGEHTIKLRVTNGANLTNEATITASPNDIPTPTYSINPPSGPADSKTVTITYPERQTGFIYQYNVNGGSWNIVDSGTTKDIVFIEPGNVTARIYDGTNYKTANPFEVTEINVPYPIFIASIHDSYNQTFDNGINYSISLGNHDTPEYRYGVNVDITYDAKATKKEYSYDNVNWSTYAGQLSIRTDTQELYARATYTTTSRVSKLTLVSGAVTVDGKQDVSYKTGYTTSYVISSACSGLSFYPAGEVTAEGYGQRSVTDDKTVTCNASGTYRCPDRTVSPSSPNCSISSPYSTNLYTPAGFVSASYSSTSSKSCGSWSFYLCIGTSTSSGSVSGQCSQNFRATANYYEVNCKNTVYTMMIRDTRVFTTENL